MMKRVQNYSAALEVSMFREISIRGNTNHSTLPFQNPGG
jgi:hypothetical protein